MKEPKRCESPACGGWTFRDDGYCSDECARIVPMSAERGIGMVTPPRDVRYSARPRVRRSEGYIASNGAWIATAEAPYGELSRDLRDLDRKQRAYDRAAARSIARATKARTAAKEVRVERIAEAPHRIMAADLAPIGNVE